MNDQHQPDGVDDARPLIEQLGEEGARRALEEQTYERIREHGYTMIGVFGEDQGDYFTYTAGMALHGLAEVVLVGIPPQAASSIVAEVAEERIAAKADLPLGRQTGVFGGEVEVHVVQVANVSDPERPLSVANQVAGAAGRSATAHQLVWPDVDGNFPWEDAAPDSLRRAQPVLGEPVL